MLPILKFDPVFKSVLWGGTRIAEFKGIPSQGDHIGESWELSPMPGHESVVADGPFKGQTLPQLLEAHGKEIMGEGLYALPGQVPSADKVYRLYQRPLHSGPPRRRSGRQAP